MHNNALQYSPWSLLEFNITPYTIDIQLNRKPLYRLYRVSKSVWHAYCLNYTKLFTIKVSKWFSYILIGKQQLKQVRWSGLSEWQIEDFYIRWYRQSLVVSSENTIIWDASVQITEVHADRFTIKFRECHKFSIPIEALVSTAVFHWETVLKPEIELCKKEEIERKRRLKQKETGTKECVNS